MIEDDILIRKTLVYLIYTCFDVKSYAEIIVRFELIDDVYPGTFLIFSVVR